MGKLVVLKLNGDFEKGFQVSLEIGNEGERPVATDSGSLPPDFARPVFDLNLEQLFLIDRFKPVPLGLLLWWLLVLARTQVQLPAQLIYYTRWQWSHRYLYKSRLASKQGFTNASDFQEWQKERRQECRQRAEELGDRFNQWLGAAEFRPIREEWLAHLKPEDEVRAIVQTDNDLLRCLPWHLWDLLTEHQYSKVEFALSAPRAKRRERRYREKVRILAILGDSRGIDVQEDRRQLEQWCGDAEIVLLEEPERKQLNRYLWDERSWDILFFAGHSMTEGAKGRIFLNKTDSFTMEELRYALEEAAERGLQVAIFNSCDGLGIAAELESLHVPQVVVMREPVPDWVAQQFLKDFLREFTGGQWQSFRGIRRCLYGS